MDIRKFSLEDLDKILEISQASFAEPWPRNEFIKYSDGLFVAEDGGEIAGFVIGKISKSKGLPAGRQGTLKLVAVNQTYRGKGVGKSLMEHIFNYFTEKNIKEIIAHSRLHNKAGCAFLESFGFKAVGTIKSYYLNGEDAYLMKKEL